MVRVFWVNNKSKIMTALIISTLLLLAAVATMYFTIKSAHRVSDDDQSF